MILVVNAGSTSLKVDLFHEGKRQSLELHEHLELPSDLKVIGHRVVHGGRFYTEPTPITSQVIGNLETLIPLAPLHLPPSLRWIYYFQEKFPQVPQYAFFDTAFHTHLKNSRFAIPRDLFDEGVQRYGFHGLAYESVFEQLKDQVGERAFGKVLMIHLGGGCSACAVENGRSIATTMGFTALDGIVMGSRCGRLDPGVILYLMEEKNMSYAEISDLLYKRSGLLGVSELSASWKEIEEGIIDNPLPKLQETFDVFCHSIIQECFGLVGLMGGVDIITFSGGIGENSKIIPLKVCNAFEWLGLKLEEDSLSSELTTQESPIKAYIFKADEALQIFENLKDC